jgi:hypothetical protein
MGRARRLYRSRNNEGWKKPPRFEIGAEVLCMYHEQWVPGRVVAQHYEEPKGVFYPYQIKLHNDQMIYAPEDNDFCIQKLDRVRFEIGAHVECNIGSADSPEWAPGCVVAHYYEEPVGLLHPYQIKLLDGQLIYAPEDNDTIIKKAARVTADKGNILEVLKTNNSKGQISQTRDKILNQHTTKKRVATLSCAFTFENPSADCHCGYLPHEHRDLVRDILAFWKSVTAKQGVIVNLADDGADTDLPPALSDPHKASSLEDSDDPDPVRQATHMPHARGDWIKGRRKKRSNV